MTEIPENVYMTENCPHCNGKFKIPKCSYCKHVHRNYYYYAEAKKCEDCNLFHRNFEYNPNAEEDYQKIIKMLEEEGER